MKEFSAKKNQQKRKRHTPQKAEKFEQFAKFV